MNAIYRAVALALLLPLGFAATSALAATPTPKPVVMPTPHLPKVRLHTEFVVEVNKLGQVVRVKSGKSCPNLTFNAQTYGNVLQMWIRHPNGTAEVGLYRVTYDYDPNGAKIARHVALISTGGDWADHRGAANDMMDEATQEYNKWEAQQKKEAQGTNLPALNSITHASPKPSASP